MQIQNVLVKVRVVLVIFQFLESICIIISLEYFNCFRLWVGVNEFQFVFYDVYLIKYIDIEFFGFVEIYFIVGDRDTDYFGLCFMSF